jgi:hypothetical protein
LPAGVMLANASGIRQGVPYITLPAATLAADALSQVTVQFSNPSRAPIAYTPHVFSGQF